MSNEWRTHIYSSSDELPDGLLKENFFHSRTLFDLSKQTPRHRPYMVTVEDANGNVAAQMLAVVRYRSSWFPPYFFTQCRVLGEGAYRLSDGSEACLQGHAHPLSEEEREQQTQLFSLMLKQLKDHIGNNVLFIEVSNLSQKMFGYRPFRENGFFPVRWMSIHNSLHSRQPITRISKSLNNRIQSAYNKGVTINEVSDEADFRSFMRLLRHHNWLKPRRYVPADAFFRGFQREGEGRLFLTKYHGHAIGCSAIVYSQKQAYLWYTAFRRKTFAPLHPADITIWNTIQDSYERGFEHIFFMDVGLPYDKNPYRDFILRFGGKPVSTFRWFRCSFGWLSKVLTMIYRGD